MAKLPEEFISRLKSANDIVDLFRTYADLKKRGHVYVCCCPLHNEKTPSCTIYPDSDPHFYCFGCHEGGDVITLLMKMENLSYMEAIQTLAQRCGMTVPSLNSKEEKNSVSRDRCYEINRETANFYYQNLLRGSDKRGLQFLASYQVKAQTIKKYGLGFAPDDWHVLRDYLKQKGFSERELAFAGVCRSSEKNLYDTFRNRLVFPIVDFRGNVTGFGGMEIDYRQPVLLDTESIRSQYLFSLHIAKNSASKELLLAEDYLNAVLLWQAGFETVIAVPGGRVMPSHAHLAAQYATEIVIIRSAFQSVSQDMLNLFSEAGIPSKILQIRQAENSAEFIRKNGADAFRCLLENAGDARKTELQNARDGLDPDAHKDKQALIQRSVKILAGIQNPLEREVYMTNTAKELEISPAILQTQVDKLRKEYKPMHSAGSRSLTKEEMQMPVQNKNKAREIILIYLMRHPEASAEMKSQLSPSAFLIYQNLYSALCQNTPLTPDESRQMEQLRADYQNTEILPQDFTNSVNILTGK